MLDSTIADLPRPEETAPFDRLVRLATRLLGAPMSIVCLARAGRLHALSWTGLPEPWNSTGNLPLPYSFCEHVMRSGQVEAIADTRGHPRLVPGSAGDILQVGAYLGIPLFAEDGSVTGVFAVMDRRPHPWNGDQIEALRDLAHAAVTEIQLRSRTLALEGAHAALREGEERVREILESITDSFVALDPDWRYTYLNQAARTGLELRTRHSPDEMIGMCCWDVVPEARGTRFEHELRRVMEQRAPAHFEALYEPFGVWYDVHAYPSRGGGISVFYRDVTERKRSEEALQESELRFRTLVENIQVVFWLREVDGTLLYVSPAYERLLGRPAWKLFQDPRDWLEAVHPEDRPGVEAALQGSAQCELGMEYRVVHADGAVRWIGSRSIPVAGSGSGPRYLAGVAEDITQRKQAEHQLRAQLEEKTALLQEVHHRVKNNLQIVSSLLNIQAKAAAGQASVEVLRESRSRIQSMALIHEILYRSGNFAEIDLADYLGRLIPEVQRSFGLGRGVRVEPELQGCRVPLDVAIPGGLILNELVGNALKHAFPDGRPGAVQVRLRRSDAGCVLEVSDDGVGLPDAAPPAGESTVGLELVRGLVRQLRGELRVRSGPGTHVRIEIPLNQEPTR